MQPNTEPIPKLTFNIKKWTILEDNQSITIEAFDYGVDRLLEL